MGCRAATILAGETATTGADGVTAAGMEAMMVEGRAGTMGKEATTGVDGVGAVVAEAVEEASEAGAAGTEVGEMMGTVAEGIAVAKTGADGRDSGMADCLTLSFFLAAKMWKG